MKGFVRANLVGKWKKSALICSLAGIGFALSLVVGLLWVPFQNEELSDRATAQERRETMSLAYSGLAQAEAKPSVPSAESGGLQIATFALG